MSEPDIDTKLLAQARFGLATELLERARLLLGSEHGVTLLVHGKAGEAEPVVAMQTTLPSRKEVRRQIVHVLYQSLLADGVNAENVNEMAAREIAEFLADTNN